MSSITRLAQSSSIIRLTMNRLSACARASITYITTHQQVSKEREETDRLLIWGVCACICVFGSVTGLIDWRPALADAWIDV